MLLSHGVDHDVRDAAPEIPKERNAHLCATILPANTGKKIGRCRLNTVEGRSTNGAF